jgi:hypothetical protein
MPCYKANTPKSCGYSKKRNVSFPSFVLAVELGGGRRDASDLDVDEG